MARRPSLQPPVLRCDELDVCSVIAIRPCLLDSSVESYEWGYSPCGEKYSCIEILQAPSRTPTSGSPLRGTPVPRHGVLRSLKEKLNEHSKQLEQSAEKLSQPESENLNLRDENQALNTESNKERRFRAQIRPMPTLETPNSGTDANLPPTASGGDASTREKAKDAQTYDVEESEPELESEKEAPDGARKAESPIVAYREHMFTKRLDAMQSMVERLLGVAPPIRKCNPDSYADTPFTDAITLIKIPGKFSFPSIKASIASFAVLSDKFVEQFASSRDLEKTSDSLYEIHQHQVEPLRGYIALFNQEKVAIPECSIPTAISAFKKGLLPDEDLYKELTKYQCKTMEDVDLEPWRR
ncbi:hypothetical protein F2Q69_00006805 [Brassica cretica]|uniref:Retrotransposon gag domain-containing protein n=1 Tax=Brassica cretica TaxID=69181 RepID=A0A8S9PQD6_BRACR|nr:hypothetical protein F2Q69_00006805 [Brassica cretica]